jgi:Ser/Thr protein kinase RdoA (MazF antagonist)
MDFNSILSRFNLDPALYTLERIGSGYINLTYKVKGDDVYILQRVNKNVFRQPELIANNLRVASDYLKKQHPGYLFLSGVKTTEGEEMAYDDEGYPWRLFPYMENTVTIDKVNTRDEAYSASAGFALLSKNLAGCDPLKFRPTIDRFHDLQWRYEQFQEALANTTAARKEQARDAIRDCQHFSFLVEDYNRLISSGALQLRVMHNDTKINNILFDASTREAVCVIDLDTLMPGYFIYDAGDMVRTFVSPVSEEEKDLSKIVFRKEIYQALVDGYLSHMHDKLNDVERSLFPFAGMMMTYIMALRMLADFLNGNIYYQITYPEQNLVRARNQLRLLDLLKTNLVAG